MRRLRRSSIVGLVLGSALFLGCGETASGDDSVVVEPPFAVRGDARGLLLSWVDGEGVHRAESRDEVPAGARGAVRVDSLDVAPGDRLDPAFVYVADLRESGPNGSYVVRRVRREAFEAPIEASAARATEAAAEPAGGIVLYGASWCGACRSAATYFREHGVAFVEKDIERDPGAREEMQRKARAAGVPTGGIPIIDVHGRILNGFDPAALDRLLAARGS